MYPGVASFQPRSPLVRRLGLILKNQSTRGNVLLELEPKAIRLAVPKKKKKIKRQFETRYFCYVDKNDTQYFYFTKEVTEEELRKKGFSGMTFSEKLGFFNVASQVTFGSAVDKIQVVSRTLDRHIVEQQSLRESSGVQRMFVVGDAYHSSDYFTGWGASGAILQANALADALKLGEAGLERYRQVVRHLHREIMGSHRAARESRANVNDGQKDAVVVKLPAAVDQGVRDGVQVVPVGEVPKGAAEHARLVAQAAPATLAVLDPSAEAFLVDHELPAFADGHRVCLFGHWQELSQQSFSRNTENALAVV